MTSTVNVIEIVNVANQPVVVGVARRVGSPIFSEYGQISVLPQAKLEVEDDRLNLAQILSMQKQGIIQFSRFKRAVTTTGGGTGSDDI